MVRAKISKKYSRHRLLYNVCNETCSRCISILFSLAHPLHSEFSGPPAAPMRRTAVTGTSSSSSVFSVQRVQMSLRYESWQDLLSYRHQHDDNKGEKHLDIGRSSKGHEAKCAQLDHLAEGETVDDFLRNFADVVKGRVEALLGEYQHHPLPKLELAQGRDPQIDEQSVEDGDGDQVQGIGDHEDGRSDQDMREEGCDACFPDVDTVI